MLIPRNWCLEYRCLFFQSWNTETGATTTCTNDDTDAGDNCIGAIACQRNFVIFPGAQSEVTSKADGTLAYIPPNGLERYCGSLLVPEGNLPVVNPAQSTPVTTCQRPFRVTGVTGDCGTPADNSECIHIYFLCHGSIILLSKKVIKTGVIPIGHGYESRTMAISLCNAFLNV